MHIPTIMTGALAASFASAAPITYQGSLQDNGAPANGTYDFRLEIYGLSTGGTQAGPTLTFNDVIVTDGTFQVEADFGDIFDSSDAYLSIQVRDGASAGAYTGLLPRSPITATPKAQHATTATTANALENPLWQSFGSTVINTPANDTLLINRTNQITSSEVFGIYGDFAGFVGMYAAGPTNSSPFYGYSIDGAVSAYTYIDNLKNWTLVNNNNSVLTITDQGETTVTGNMHADDYEYNTPKTNYISIPSVVFQSTRSDDPYRINSGFGGMYVPTQGNAELVAPIQIPHGATVTSVTFYYTDNAPGDMLLRLYKQQHSNLSFDDLASISSGSSPGSNVNRTDSTIDFPIINNTVNSYFLSAQSAGWPGNATLSINSVIVEYTTTQPD